MKKRYTAPKMTMERFEANEYVAACVTATVQCALPGKSTTAHDGTSPIYTESGTGLQHGICANEATIYMSDTDGVYTGYEVSNGEVQTNRPIKVVGSYDSVGTYNRVSWTSTDNNWKDTYTHVGTIKVTYVDDTHPNHS